MSKFVTQLQAIFAFNPTERVWQLPFFMALGVGLVLSLGAYFERIDLGLISMIGAMAFLYTPSTPLYHRMAVVMCCSFGMSLCFLLGLLTHLLPALAPLLIGAVAFASSVLVRYYSLGAPGYFYFVLSALLASFFPFETKDFIFLVGLICVGGMVANLMAFLYSLSVIYIFKNTPVQNVPKRGHLGFDAVVVDSLIMGFFIGLALFVGHFLELERSYWVAVSCTVIMQGITLDSVWIKQIQRILGTLLGVLFAWFLLSIHFNALAFVLLMMFLVFMTETLVFRNYALAMIFITPYVTYLAEEANFMHYDTNLLIIARLEDVIVGSILGLMGGFVIYKKALRVPFKFIADLIFKMKWG